MKSVGALQVAVVLLLVASAASCEVAKEYSNRVFKPMPPQKKSDSTVTALKFMEFDSDNASDSIDLKDLASKDIKEAEKTEMIRDTVSRPETVSAKPETSAPVIETKDVARTQPIDATKAKSTRTKKVRQ